MPRSVDLDADLLSLAAELLDLEQAQQALPCGAHIHPLLQLAIERVEERMSMLRRVQTVQRAQCLPGRDVAA